ncbi:MAG TPA: hypothetical protein VFV66_06305 [Nonomuraea sp.]|nr:hypothetical protein [Nonomuraea sp.]
MSSQTKRAMLTAAGMLALTLAVPGSSIFFASSTANAAAATGTSVGVPLVRYFDGLKHWSTTGQKPNAKYREEGRVPILTTPAEGTRPIYSCMSGTQARDQFLAHSPDCENRVSSTGNNVVLRLEGYLYARPAGNRKPIYRCYVPHTRSHFFSLKSSCESNPPKSTVKSEFVLGYLPT